MRILFTIGLLLLTSDISSAQTTWIVDQSGNGDFTTIQSALNDANVIHGDTVLVKLGGYTENINFVGKDVHLKSELGPSLTQINGNRANSVVRFDSGESSAAILEGFTLTNGRGYSVSSRHRGGGIYCKNSSPTIIGNIISFNEGHLGGGIYLESSNAVIQGNDIVNNDTRNFAADTFGGGIFINGSGAPLIDSNLIDGNLCGEDGGGIFSESANTIISNNTITNNECGGVGRDSRGGGIRLWDYGNPIVKNNLIGHNQAEDWGGGISIECRYSIVIENNEIYENSTSLGQGAGIAGNNRYEGRYFIQDNLIRDNHSNSYGGGISMSTSVRLTLSGNQILRNEAAGSHGGGVYLDHPVSTIVENNQVAENIVAGFGGGFSIKGNNAGPTILGNTIQANQASGSGGGVYLWANPGTGNNPRSTLYNNLIVDNHADDSGGGLFCDVAAPTLANCTLAGNSATTDGAAIKCVNAPATPVLEFENGIVWGNSDTSTHLLLPAGTSLKYSCVEAASPADPWFGSGSFSADPKFISSLNGGDYFLSQPRGGQTETSSCIDMGDPNLNPFGSTCTQGYEDLGIIDVGFHYPIFAADDDVDNDGLLDADELSTHGTNPFLFDSDEDGLGDGLELGMTNALVDPNHTDLTVFIEDSDPTTTTNPLASDSDGGGVSDGIEDQNQNGAFDTWETNPNSAADDQFAMYVFDLEIGNTCKIAVFNARSKATIVPCYSLNGVGPTDVGYGINMDLSLPIKQTKPFTTNVSGYGEKSMKSIPFDTLLVGMTVYFQSLEIKVGSGNTFRVSNSVEIQIAAP